MKMDKIWNSGLGIALAILALLVAGRVVRIISWDLPWTDNSLRDPGRNHRPGGFILPRQEIK